MQPLDAHKAQQIAMDAYDIETEFDNDSDEEYQYESRVTEQRMEITSRTSQPAIYHLARLLDLRQTHKRHALFWQFLVRIKDVQKQHMCSRNIVTGSMIVPMGFMMFVAREMQLDEMGEGFLTSVWAMFCSLLAISYRPLTHQSIIAGTDFYSTAVYPHVLAFDCQWVTIRYAGLQQYTSCDRRSVTLDLKRADMPDFVELERSGHRAILLTRPWVVLKGGYFYKFTDTEHSLTM